MKREHLKYLVCPECKSDLDLVEASPDSDDSVETGVLQCRQCQGRYDILRHIPRFVPLDNYSKGFGFQWSRHARTQYDSANGTQISESRFFNETKWPRNLAGQVLLEVGSGSGRFTEPAASTGAMVISVDYSHAVDANYATNGRKENVLIVQGDIYRLPFRESFFDKVFCFGVLQHTPDVDRAFHALPRYVKPGGNLAVDVYVRHRGLRGLLVTKYWVRPLVRGVPSETLYKWCDRYIRWMWPVSSLLDRLPVLGSRLNWKLLIPNYRSTYPLSKEQLKEWAVLDLFDMLSPVYDSPQTLDTVLRWFREANLTGIEVHYGYNGIEGRGIKPLSPPATR